jgi:hypothetical protein
MKLPSLYPIWNQRLKLTRVFIPWNKISQNIYLLPNPNEMSLVNSFLNYFILFV